MILVESIPVGIYAGQSDYRTAHMLHNHARLQSGKEDVSKCPCPEVECKHTLDSGEYSDTGSFCTARI